MYTYHTIVAHSRTILPLWLLQQPVLYHSNRAVLWRFNFASKDKM